MSMDSGRPIPNKEGFTTELTCSPVMYLDAASCERNQTRWGGSTMPWTTQSALESSVVDRGSTRTLSCLRRIRVGEAKQESRDCDAESK